MDLERPKVGVAIIIKRADGRVLVLRRKGAHGQGTWTVPGGHLEFGESWEQCAIREAVEETGVVVKDIRFVGCTNDVFSEEGRHYVTIFMMGDYAFGQASIREPDKCDALEWVLPDELPMPVFLSTLNLLRQGFSFRALDR